MYKLLLGYGDHVQYSAFLCELSAMEFQRIKGQLASSINHKQDQVIVLKMGKAQNSIDNKLECIGKSYVPPSRVFVV